MKGCGCIIGIIMIIFFLIFVLTVKSYTASSLKERNKELGIEKIERTKEDSLREEKMKRFLETSLF